MIIFLSVEITLGEVHVITQWVKLFLRLDAAGVFCIHGCIHDELVRMRGVECEGRVTSVEM